MNKMEQLTFDPDIWSGRTSPALSAPTKERTLESSSKKQQGSANRPPLFLDLRKGSGLTQEPSWVMGGALLGEYLTHSFGEFPSVAVESHLSQILEEQPLPKYSLSATTWKDFAAAIAKRFGGANQTERGTEHLTYCIQGNSIDRADTAGCNGKGVKEGVSYMLNTIDRPAVYDYDRRHGKCQDVEVAPTVTAKYGTGGGNTPLVYDARGNGEGGTAPTITGDHQNRVTDYTALAVGFPLGFRPENTREYPEKCTTICNGTRPGSCNGVITIDRAAFNQGKNAQYDFKVDDEGINSTVVSKGPSAVCSQSTVRRLTPLECERLQGFPDGWTDIGDYTDTNGKKRKTSDSARYKALGNSIALPSWAWLLERLNRYCRYHTMASLFDGIGGFPLIWETLNGSGSCVWASEIEEFPIAVTKYHL